MAPQPKFGRPPVPMASRKRPHKQPKNRDKSIVITSRNFSKHTNQQNKISEIYHKDRNNLTSDSLYNTLHESITSFKMKMLITYNRP